MAVEPKLTMTCTITPITGQDTAGDETFGTAVEGVKCFAFGSKTRLRDEKGQEFDVSHQILLLPTATIDVNYKITNVAYKDTTVVASGRVVKVEKNYHPKKGLVLQQAFITIR